MKRERMKFVLRTKAIKRWRRGKNIEPTDSEFNAFVAGFNMGWKSSKRFQRKRTKRGAARGAG